MNILKNNKGFSFIDSIIALFLVGMLAIILSTFNSYVTASSLKSEQNMAFYEIVNNSIQKLYGDDWTALSANTVEKDGITVYVTFSDYQPDTEYHTQRIKVTFTYGDFVKEYLIEKEIGA